MGGTHSEKGNAFSLRSSRTFKSSDSRLDMPEFVVAILDIAASGCPR